MRTKWVMACSRSTGVFWSHTFSCSKWAGTTVSHNSMNKTITWKLREYMQQSRNVFPENAHLHSQHRNYFGSMSSVSLPSTPTSRVSLVLFLHSRCGRMDRTHAAGVPRGMSRTMAASLQTRTGWTWPSPGRSSSRAPAPRPTASLGMTAPACSCAPAMASTAHRRGATRSPVSTEAIAFVPSLGVGQILVTLLRTRASMLSRQRKERGESSKI